MKLDELLGSKNHQRFDGSYGNSGELPNITNINSYHMLVI